jgi:hypothetical protein
MASCWVIVELSSLRHVLLSRGCFVLSGHSIIARVALPYCASYSLHSKPATAECVALATC